jgi:hypothetical protein
VKTCSECHALLPLTSFNKRNLSRDGLAYRCRPCDNAESAKWRNKNPERNVELKANAYQRHKEHYDLLNRNWVSEHKLERNAISQTYYQKNIEIHMVRVRDWKRRNPWATNEIRMRYVSSKLSATPQWLTGEQIEQMRNIYRHAIDCRMVSGQKYQVDHIVPLQGENVCGLHVPWNLQVLPVDLNTKKANRHDDWNTTK